MLNLRIPSPVKWFIIGFLQGLRPKWIITLWTLTTGAAFLLSCWRHEAAGIAIYLVLFCVCYSIYQSTPYDWYGNKQD